ncbi:MAG: hypothetical protein VX112_04830 [Pseudomonadota bacterium]|nr:hypothetical protein [Pseudomonadota bacterium]
MIFTSCKNVYPDIDGELDDKQFYHKINKIEKENRKILNNDISMNVFIEFLNRCPELVHTLFTYKELIDRFDDTLKDIASKALNTKIPRDVKDYKVTPLLSFLLGPDANTNILLKLATKNHLFFENLKSVAQKITEIEGLIYDNDPEFFNARPKSNDQLSNPFYHSHSSNSTVSESLCKSLSDKITNLIHQLSEINSNNVTLIENLTTQRAYLLLSDLEKYQLQISHRLRRLHSHLDDLNNSTTHENYSAISELVKQDLLLPDQFNEKIKVIKSRLESLQEKSTIPDRVFNEAKPKNEQISPNNKSTQQFLTKNSLIQKRSIQTSKSTDENSVRKNATDSVKTQNHLFKSVSQGESNHLNNVFYKSCLDLFFKTEYCLLAQESSMIHFVPLRFLIFLMEVHEFQNQHDDLVPLSNSYDTKTVRNMYTHHGFFFPEEVSQQLIDDLED